MIENEILAFFITIMCDKKFHHTLGASVIAFKCDKKYHHILSVLIITKKFDVGLITLIMRCSLHFQRQCSLALHVVSYKILISFFRFLVSGKSNNTSQRDKVRMFLLIARLPQQNSVGSSSQLPHSLTQEQPRASE